MPRRSTGRIHRHAINSPGHAHELTFSCYRRFPFLKAERACQWLAEAIEAARPKHPFDLWAYVFMPEHVHLIVYPRQVEYSMSKIMAGIKLPMARRAIHFLQQASSLWLARITRQRGKHTERLFWQYGGGYDRNITGGKTLLRMIDYLHNNPVRRGLVERAVDWKWSSAAALEDGIGPIRLDSIPWDWLVDA